MSAMDWSTTNWYCAYCGLVVSSNDIHYCNGYKHNRSISKCMDAMKLALANGNVADAKWQLAIMLTECNAWYDALSADLQTSDSAHRIVQRQETS